MTDISQAERKPKWRGRKRGTEEPAALHGPGGASTATSQLERKAKRGRKRDPLAFAYPGWFYAPAAVIYGVLFLFPTVISFYFGFTRWNLTSAEFIGFENFQLFFTQERLFKGFVNTVIFAALTSAAKVILGLLLAVVLTSGIFARGYLRAVVFFPVLVSTIGVGVTFKILLDPFDGLVNQALAAVGIAGPAWLTDPTLAIYSIALVDIWKGVGLAALIFIAGIVAIPHDYFEAARVDGANSWTNFWNITVPLVRPAMVTVVILSLIGGLRTFDLIWTMTGGGPGFASDTIASVIYKQYAAGYYGLSTAGNVILFLLVTAVVLPIYLYLNRKSKEL